MANVTSTSTNGRLSCDAALAVAVDLLDQVQHPEVHEAADQEDLDWLLGWNEEEELSEDQSYGWNRAPRQRNYRRW